MDLQLLPVSTFLAMTPLPIQQISNVTGGSFTGLASFLPILARLYHASGHIQLVCNELIRTLVFSRNNGNCDGARHHQWPATFAYGHRVFHWLVYSLNARWLYFHRYCFRRSCGIFLWHHNKMSIELFGDYRPEWPCISTFGSKCRWLGTDWRERIA